MRYMKLMLIITSVMFGYCECRQNCVNERMIDGIDCRVAELLVDGINAEVATDGINAEVLFNGINAEVLFDGINAGIIIDGINCAECHYVCTNCGWKSSNPTNECPDCGCSSIRIELNR